jgi:amino-acid N-acetyltransferase
VTDPQITLSDADATHLDRIESLLDANGLPSGDVRAKPDCFVVARDDGEFVGVGGVEACGSAGLLRSVVVVESRRGRGYGTALCDALEDRARSRGIATLYLLTTSAAPFFRRRGYEDVDRERVPTPVRQTTEFSDLCPATATCLRRDLGE